MDEGSGDGTCVFLSWRSKKQMSKATFSKLAGVIFLIVALAHALRLIFKWDLVIAGWQVPMWTSGVAAVIAAFLAYEGFRTSQSNKDR